jgi:glutamyl-tRNA synthetase
MAYRDEGIVPEAFRNFLALLGWTPKDSSEEILGDRDLIEQFGLEGISKSNAVFDRPKLDWFNTEYIRAYPESNAVFDRPKLDWFNTEYIRAYPAEKLIPLIEEEWKKAGLVPIQREEGWLAKTVDLLKPRARNLKDFAGAFRAFFCDTFEADPAAVVKFLSDATVRELLVELGERYAADAEPFSETEAERVLRDLAAEKNVKAGGLINGARVALTGQAVAPSLFAVMVALGKDRTIFRLQRSL